MLIKSTLTFLILFVVAAWAVATGRVHKLREIFYMGIPVAIYMVFPMAGGMNTSASGTFCLFKFFCPLLSQEPSRHSSNKIDAGSMRPSPFLSFRLSLSYIPSPRTWRTRTKHSAAIQRT